MKVSIVYWSGTGNTETMANAVAEGAKEAGAEVELYNVSQAGDVSDCDVLLLGCPAMGNEELEPEEFEPFFAAIESSLSGRKIGLFKSGCSAHTNGRTANGCAHGSREWKRQAAL